MEARATKAAQKRNARSRIGRIARIAGGIAVGIIISRNSLSELAPGTAHFGPMKPTPRMVFGKPPQVLKNKVDKLCMEKASKVRKVRARKVKISKVIPEKVKWITLGKLSKTKIIPVTPAERSQLKKLFADAVRLFKSAIAPTPAWAEGTITPETVISWFGKKKSRIEYLSVPFEPWGKKRAQVLGPTAIGLGMTDKESERTHRGIPVYDLRPAIAVLRGIDKADEQEMLKQRFSDDVKMVGSGTRGVRTEDGKEVEAWVYYITDPGLRGLIALEAWVTEDETFTAIANMTQTNQITSEFDMVALPNNGCAVATQDEVIFTGFKGEGSPFSGSEDDRPSRFTVNLTPLIDHEGGKKPVEPTLACHTDSDGTIYVALRAANWDDTFVFNLATSEVILASSTIR